MTRIKFTRQDKDNLFWYLIVPGLIFVTIFISMSPWLLELLATPPGRVFSGINRWSTDYYLYLSYVEQGIRGWLPVKLFLTTSPHPALFSHMVYTLPGLIFGRILGLNSVAVYHLFRTIYGAIFLYVSLIFFYTLSKSKTITLLAFLFSFYIAGSSRSLTWLQEQNIIGRASSPLHYSAGFIVFLIVFLYFFYSKSSLINKIITFGVLLNLLLLTNPFNYQLMAFTFAVYGIIKFLFSQKNNNFFHEAVTIIGGFILSLPLLYYFYYYLSTKPWGVVGVSPKFYVITTPPVALWEAVTSVGIVFWLGGLGILGLLIKITGVSEVGFPATRIAGIHRRSIDGRESETGPVIFLIIWPVIQFFLLIYGDRLKIHPPRAFSGLYFLPLALFSAYLIVWLSRQISKKVKLNSIFISLMIVIILFAATFSNYRSFYKTQLYAFTNFINFDSFSYPTKNQVEAYKFLEKNTPPGSGVFAMFEASSQLMGFSGNSTELGMDHQKKVIFYTNQITDKQAYDFLKQNNFQYVYLGYQEKSVGGNIEKYPFVKKIYGNPEASVYKVL